MLNFIVLIIVVLWPFFEKIMIIDFGANIPDLNLMRSVFLCLLVVALISVNKINEIKKMNFFISSVFLFFLYFSINIIINNVSVFQSIQFFVDVYFIPVVLYFIMINYAGNIKSKNVYSLILLCGILIGILGISETIVGHDIFGSYSDKNLVSWGYYRSSGPFNDGITYAGTMLFFVPFAWYCFQKRLVSKNLYFIALVITSLASILHLSRACWMLLAMIYFVIFGFTKNIVFMCILSVFIALFYVFGNPANIQNTDLYQNRISDSSTMVGRYERYQMLFAKYLKHPVVGIGYNNLAKDINAHNSYLQTLVELGGIGFIFWITMIFSPFIVLLSIYKKKGNVLCFWDSVFKRSLLCVFLVVFFIPMTVSTFSSYAMFFQYIIIIVGYQYSLTGDIVS